MTKRELIEYCKSLPGVYEDYPFDETWAVMRHSMTKKSFAFIYERGEKLFVNLKCEPMRAEFLRELYQGVTPAYHMNKVHWNSVDPNSDVPGEVVCALVRDSYSMTKRKKQQKNEE